ncbi:putative non-specific serine/threonine protein kinase [Rosa chinensis]|uniref:Putative non-specific serine/threonine protein kinase n=1 Tax=Rosa chinensis TaxID=74649 RepID=A0A2P6Q3B3_ROSCH|nr:putative non-specific serine/threonine protein kinase [Rosa chinensis]
MEQRKLDRGCVRQTKLLCKSHTSKSVSLIEEKVTLRESHELLSRDLIDIQEVPSGGVDLFICLAHSGDMENQIKLTASLAAICFISILAVILFGLHRRHPQGKGLDFVDEELAKGYSLTEVRCIHIGLLCVQDDAANRPTMPEVVFMLSSETDAPQPKQPVFP